MNNELIDNVVIAEVLAPVSAGSSTDSNSDILDMAGYEGAIFIVPITDSAATGVATLNVQENTANSDSGMTTVDSATKTCTVNDDINNTLLIVAIHKPLKRYIQGNVTSATANIAFGNMIAIKYGAKKLPITDDSSVSDVDQSVGV
jgi:hypothetical protein